MSDFTPPLWRVLEMEHDTGNGFRIGLDDYPIFDEAHRVPLNQFIIGEYMNREIGLETVPLFMYRLRQKMHQIMPFYNQMYKSELLIIDPLATFNLTTTRDDTTTENVKNAANADVKVASQSGARNVNSDMPETMLSDDEDYATTAADANATSSTTTDTTSGNTSDTTGALNGVSKTTGFQGSVADLLQRFRGTFLNLDLQVTRDCGDLFMLIVSNGQEFMPSRELRRPLPQLGRYI